MPPKIEVSATLHQGAVYRPSSELKLDAMGAQNMLKESDEGIDCGEWEREFASLERLRAVVVYAPEIFMKEDYLKETLPKLLRRIEAQTNNLRSQIVKNALMLLEEMFRHMAKVLDKFLDKLVPCVIKRMGDQNKFLAESADVTMAACVEYCPPARIVKSCWISIADKDQKIREKAVLTLAMAVGVMDSNDSSYRELLEKILTITGPLLYDNSEKARANAKQIATTLIHNAVSMGNVAELRKTYVSQVVREYHDRFEKILSKEAGPTVADTPKSKEKKGELQLKVPSKAKSVSPSSSAGATPTQAEAPRKIQTPLAKAASAPPSTTDNSSLEFYGVTLDSLEGGKDLGMTGSGRRGSVDSVASSASSMALDEANRGRMRTKSPASSTRKRSDSTDSVKSSASQMSTSSRAYFEPTLPDSFTVVYKISSELVLPAECDAKKLLAKAVLKLGNGDWKEEFQSLDDVRAVVVTSPDLVETTQSRSDVVRKVHACVSHVRHCVIVNALMCLEDMFRAFRLSMDGYVAFLLPTIVKRVIDQKEKILAETAHATLTALIECTTPARSVKLMYTLWTDDRNLATKNCCTKYVLLTVTRLGTAIADKTMSELIVSYAGPMMHDRQDENRKHAKDVLTLLCNAHMTAGSTNDLKASIDKLEKNKERAATLVRQIIAGEVPPEKEAPPARVPVPVVPFKPKIEKKQEEVVEPKVRKEKTERQPLLRTKEELAELERIHEEARRQRASDPTSIKLDFSGVQSKVVGNLRTKEELAELDRQKTAKPKVQEPASIKLDFSGVTSKVAPILRGEGDASKDEPKSAKPGEKFCAECGGKISGDVKFCTTCGTKRGGAPPPPKAVVVANAGIVRSKSTVGASAVKPTAKSSGLGDLMAEINAKAASTAQVDMDETF
jgi:hypothetical protein